MPRPGTYTAAFVASFLLGLATTPGHAQSAGSHDASLQALTGYLNADPLLLAAFVLVMTLGTGLLLDFLRGRFRRSNRTQPGRVGAGDAQPAPANPMALKRAARLMAENRLTTEKTRPAKPAAAEKADALIPDQPSTGH